MNNFIRELGRLTKEHPDWVISFSARGRPDDIDVHIQDGALFTRDRFPRYAFEKRAAGFDSILAEQLRALEDEAKFNRLKHDANCKRETPAPTFTTDGLTRAIRAYESGRDDDYNYPETD